MKIRSSQLVTGVAVLLFALPAFAHTDSTPFDVNQAETIGTAQLQPGHYELKVPDQSTEANVLKNGKVVAQVPCHWVNLQTKATEDAVISNGNKIIQVQFGGHSEAVDFN